MRLIDPALLNDPGFIGLLSIAMMLFGPCLGSFASAIAYRAPRGISWISDKGKGARSACPHCGHSLGFFDLIPILSWLFLRGRCRNCHAPVSALYPALEIAALIVSLLLLKTLGAGLLLVVTLMALPFFLALTIISWQGFGLPRQLLIILAVLGVIFVVTKLGHASDPLLILRDAVLGGIIFLAAGLAIARLRRAVAKSGEVISDAPFLAVCGIWLGVKMMPAFLIVGGVVGVGLTVLRVLLKMPRIHIMTSAYTVAFIIVLLAGSQIMAQLIP